MKNKLKVLMAAVGIVVAVISFHEALRNAKKDSN